MSSPLWPQVSQCSATKLTLVWWRCNTSTVRDSWWNCPRAPLLTLKGPSRYRGETKAQLGPFEAGLKRRRVLTLSRPWHISQVEGGDPPLALLHYERMFMMALYSCVSTTKWTGRQELRSWVAGLHVSHDSALYCSRTNLQDSEEDRKKGCIKLLGVVGQDDFSGSTMKVL